MTGAPDPRFEAFAAREPFFAVLTAPKFLRANLTAEHEREFFASGEELADWIFHVIEHRLSPHFSPMSTLEYGCGVGRLAIPLARRPGSVTAVDRSPAMLAAARREADRRGVPHLEFHTPEQFFAGSRRFDLLTCFHVLQRLPSAEGVPLLQALIARIASGGIGVFHVPYRTSASPGVQAARWARARLPLAHGIANLLRGKPVGEPLIPSHVYVLDEVLRACDAASIPATHVVFEHQQELSSAIVFAEVPLPSITGVDERGRPLPGTALRVQPTEAAERPIQIRDLLSETSIDELNGRAETYFASLTDWDDQFAKPFSKVAEAPPILASAGVLIDGLRLRPGDTVLDFGAGAGWLARCLTQLGCRVILLDVSPTALQLAQDLYRRLPVVGGRPEPVFLRFDGRRIDLADASVDRIVSFDAFHHVPNPEEVLAEFGRILAPGGIAGFAEPGARHSLGPRSQFEMRTYGVVENDIDVHAIWRTARCCGFRDLKLAIFNGPSLHVSIAEYEDFLAAGQTTERWLTATRVFQRDVRQFFLIREGQEARDSRSVDGLACVMAVPPVAGPVRAGEPLVLEAAVTNSGPARWLPAGAAYGGVRLGAHVYDETGVLLDFEIYGEPLTDPPRAVEPGETVRARITIPPQPPGRYRVELDCVASRVTWFAQAGSAPATVTIEIYPATAT